MFVASQMWLLGRILPLIVGEYVPENDEHWSTSDDYAAYVTTLISDHHHDCCRLYPHSSIIPKMHFMVHMPRMIIK